MFANCVLNFRVIIERMLARLPNAQSHAIRMAIAVSSANRFPRSPTSSGDLILVLSVSCSWIFRWFSSRVLAAERTFKALESLLIFEYEKDSSIWNSSRYLEDPQISKDKDDRASKLSANSINWNYIINFSNFITEDFEFLVLKNLKILSFSNRESFSRTFRNSGG